MASAALVFESGLRNRKAVIADFTFDSSYPTGGEAFTPALIGLNAFDLVIPEQPSGYQVEYVRSTGKLKVYVNGAVAAHSHTHVAHTHDTDAHTHTGPSHTHDIDDPGTSDVTDAGGTGATGANTPAAGSSVISTEGTAGAVSAGAKVEVANATNLATLVVRVFAIGT